MSDTNEKSLAAVKEYVDASTQGAEMLYDEASGMVMVNAGPHGLVHAMTSSSAPTITGDLRVEYSSAAPFWANTGGSQVIAEPGPGYLQAMSTLNKLVTAVEAGACCRCAPTEVCPECHDLNLALDSAKKTLEAFSQPAYARHEASEGRWIMSQSPVPPAGNTVTLQGSYTGTTVVSGNTLTVAPSGSSAGLTIKAGT